VMIESEIDVDLDEFPFDVVCVWRRVGDGKDFIVTSD
jgi:hypothetical protein